ncbi:hypothetical protein [Neptuniibacter halophilus]|uniref:hypothetical protein n=1 Tax=Neptuniibacter halophilus TaxID=651666 RepID=UPI00257315FC|nr:hypothetical protein [Neptuniibacter halophilus]
MKKLILAACLAGLAFNCYAEKPEWAGNKGGKNAAHAEKNDKKQKKEKYKDKQERQERDDDERNFVSDRELLDDLFSDRQRDLIRDYYRRYPDSGTGDYRGQKKSLPYGLQKKLARDGQLPPGWQKKLTRGEILDGDLLDQAELLPDELLDRLQGRDLASEIIRLKDKVVRVGKGEGTIIDVIDIADILTGRRSDNY